MEFEVNGRKTKVPTPSAAVVGIIAAVVVVAVVMVTSIGWVTVKGSERVVWQTFSGVKDEVGLDGMHFYIRWTTTPHIYSIGSDNFVIDDKAKNVRNSYMDEDEQIHNEPDMDPLTIPVKMDNLTPEEIASGTTTGPTPVALHCIMQYHIDGDEAKLVKLHKKKTKAFRTTFIKPIIMKVINDSTTVRDARTVFQGAGRVELQNEIQKKLQSVEVFDEFGIIIDSFVFRKVLLINQEFLQLITKEAQAEQRRKTAEKEQKAAEAEAKKAESEARAEQNRRLVEAETKKNEEIARAEAKKEQEILAAQGKAEQVRLAAQADKEKEILKAQAAAEQVRLAAQADKEKEILKAQAAAEQVTLAAGAQKERDELEGQGLKLRKIAEAEGVLALGRAEADAKRMLLMAFEGEGGTRFAQVEIAKAMGEGIEKIYYVPSTMSINAIAKDFNNAITVGLPNNNFNNE